MSQKIITVDHYISNHKDGVKARLKSIRELIFNLYPNVAEKIGYGMPSYKLNGRQFLYYAAFKNHIGFYSYPNVYLHFKNELKKYKTGTGSVQFPHDQELPLELIAKMIKFRAQELLSNH